MITPTLEQQEAIDEIVAYFKGETDYDFVRLEGFAGTGKSTVISLAVAKIQSSVVIGITAPTHKAVRILKSQSSNKNRFIFGTIHSLFGLRLKHNERTGKIEFKPDYENQNKVSTLHVLIVDECSMLNSSLLKSILDHKKLNPQLKILFTGDPLQIPPVGEDKSLVFSRVASNTWRIKDLELTTIMRQLEDNPILQFATDIRLSIQETKPAAVPAAIQRIVNSDANIEQIVREYFDTEEFRTNTDHCKFLSWSRQTVGRFNNIARRIILDNPTESIVVGEKLVADSVIKSHLTGSTLLYTSAEMEVKKVEIVDVTMHVILHLGEDHTDREHEELVFKAYKCVVSTSDYDDTSFEPTLLTLMVLHPSSEQLHKKTLDNLFKIASTQFSKKAWAEYGQFSTHFAKVIYNYALTCHKSQGSTYGTVFSFDSNILKNCKIVERNSIRYVSVTRAKDKLVILE